MDPDPAFKTDNDPNEGKTSFEFLPDNQATFLVFRSLVFSRRVSEGELSVGNWEGRRSRLTSFFNTAKRSSPPEFVEREFERIFNHS